MQLELVPVNGGRIVLRTPKDEANDQEDDMQRYIVKFVEVRHYEMTVNAIDVKRRSGTRRTAWIKVELERFEAKEIAAKAKARARGPALATAGPGPSFEVPAIR